MSGASYGGLPEWGEPIAVNGKRPEWLHDDDLLFCRVYGDGYSRLSGVEHKAGAHADCITWEFLVSFRLPLSHPYYLASTPEPAEQHREAEPVAEELRHKLLMIVSHATGGASQDIDASINDICVRISQARNLVWEGGVEKGRKEAHPAASNDRPEVGGEAGWQPIETARNGDLVWCFEPHEMGGFMFAGFLRNDGSWGNNLDLGDQQPTHWMPLPPAPGEGA